MHVVRQYSVALVLVFWIRTQYNTPDRRPPYMQACTGRVDSNMILFCKSVCRRGVFICKIPIEWTD